MEGQVPGLGQISNVVSLNSAGGTLATASLAGLTAATVTVPVTAVQTLPALAFYNYTTSDGQLLPSTGQLLPATSQLLPTTGQAVQIELAPNSDIARQFSQQVQAQYSNIQVALVPPAQQHIIQLQSTGMQQLPAQPEQTIQLDQDIKIQQEFYVAPTAKDVESVIKKVKTKSGSSDRVTCNVCEKTVSCLATLRDHMRTHTGERPFECSECKLAFSQRSNLRMHKRLHTGERPYMCGICGKTFARSSHLPAHMRTHTGEKPFKCSECDHSFITAQQLKNHHRVHTGEKPWKCDQCPAAFTHSSSLSTHKKKHTGNKPYECDICNKKFFFTSALEKHSKVHTKIRPFKCTNCDNTFKYKESMTVHMERYCGKQMDKKPRAPRKPDAKKPGPKPGTGRKYVQQRRGRPRGRPRKKGKGNRRSRRPVKLESVKMEEDAADQKPGNSFLPIKGQHDGESFLGIETDVLEDHSRIHSLLGEDEQDIPTAELKVENIDGTNETRVVLNSSVSSSAMAEVSHHGSVVAEVRQHGSAVTDATQHISAVAETRHHSVHSVVAQSPSVMACDQQMMLSHSMTSTGSAAVHGQMSQQKHATHLASGDVSIAVNGHMNEYEQQDLNASASQGGGLAPANTSNVMHIDSGTSLTIISPEEAERHIASGAYQVLTLPQDMLHLITSEQFQQLQMQPCISVQQQQQLVMEQPSLQQQIIPQQHLQQLQQQASQQQVILPAAVSQGQEASKGGAQFVFQR